MARVLITRLSSFGDVAMLVPVIASVARKYPRDTFTVLTRGAFAPLFKDIAFNINVISFNPNGRHKGFLGLLKLIKRLNSSGFSHVADEHDVLRTILIRSSLYIRGVRVAVIKKGKIEKSLIVKSKDTSTFLKHTVDRYLDVFHCLGFDADIKFSSIIEFIPNGVDQLDSYIKTKTTQWIGVAPFAKHKGKVYPLDKMEKVVAMLSKRVNTSVFLFGAGDKENAILSNWESKYENVHNTVGHLKLKTELIFMSHLEVMISMDSANAHLASLVKTPVVSIWGATHPCMGFYGFNQDLKNIVQADNIPCRPCSVFGDAPCTNEQLYACMYAIDEQTVVDKVEEVIREGK